MHEYGHLHEYVSNEYLRGSELLSEFASIYFEIKTVEFLINCGFQKEIVDLVESFRTDSNLKHAVYLYPILGNNKGIDDTNYFDNLFPKQVKSYIQKVIYDLTKDSDTIHNLNCESTSIADGIKYFFCTFLATYAANNFESEEVLSIIESSILDDENIHNILKLLGIIKEKSSAKKNKVKINKPTK